MAVKQNVKKEHWMRVKALSRWLATGIADEYDSIKPVAGVKRQLQEALYVQVQNPLLWSTLQPVDNARQHIYDVTADVTRSPDGNALFGEVAEATRQAAEPVRASLL